MARDPQTVDERMQMLIDQWQQAGDRRSDFLRCYVMMTANMLTAVGSNAFHDPGWVNDLLHRFAGYYFSALNAYEKSPSATPLVWRTAHDTAQFADRHIMQNLLLGINAHINYDLVLTMEEILRPEWARLDDQARRERKEDHQLVNDIIGRTIDVVQDEVIEPDNQTMKIVDAVLGPLDEWVLSRVIVHWRERVWQRAVQLVALDDPRQREALIQVVEDDTMQRAEIILLGDGPPNVMELL